MKNNLLHLSEKIDETIYESLEAKVGFDFEKAGARFLGRDMAAIAIPGSKKTHHKTRSEPHSPFSPGGGGFFIA